MEITRALLEEITRQVVAAMEAAPVSGPRGLLLGGGSWIPTVPELHWAGERDYQGEIAPFTLVLCRQVSAAQLCDMALGRDNTPVTCAVSKALLAGKPVYLAEEGLPHRASQATSNPRYYAMLENYVTQLAQFGVRTAPRAELEQLLRVPAAPAPQAAPACTRAPAEEAACSELFCGVLTAEEARRLAHTCGGTLRLGETAILTPLARDVLREKQITLLREEKASC